jgi:hypothetical protein
MREERDDDGLEELFGRARIARPPAALVARVLADAEAQRPRQSRAGIGAVLLQAIGGWRSAAGLVAASAAGLLIGYAAPDALPGFGAAASGNAEAAYDLIDLAPGYGVQAAFEG